MATKKKTASKATAKKSEPAREPAELETAHDRHYNELVAQYAEALETFNKGDFGKAKAAFDSIVLACEEEPVLMDRAQAYARICERKLVPPPAEPQSSEEQYYRAVLLANEGRPDEALPLLDKALQEHPSSAKLLYARASVWAIKADVDAAVRDLRQAIAVDPHVRFQATNDPDFEAIREEPAFIDLIEPTPSGA